MLLLQGRTVRLLVNGCAHLEHAFDHSRRLLTTPRLDPTTQVGEALDVTVLRAEEAEEAKLVSDVARQEAHQQVDEGHQKVS